MNLIICCTPFQILIAEKIIEMHPNESFYGIMIQQRGCDSKKYTHYYERLKRKCELSEMLILDNQNLLNSLFNLTYMRFKHFFLPKIDKLFLANIQTDILFMLLTGLKSPEIYTFDDGIGSLINNNRYLKTVDYSFSRKMFYKILSNKYSTSKIIEKSKKHFTIYRKMENFMGRLEYLQIFSLKKNNINNFSFTRSVSILLGQPIYESIDGKRIEDNINLTQNIISSFDIHYYFPHPRENYIINKTNYIKTKLIFEDYILNRIKKEPETKFIIYTFLSGAALNLIEHPNIEIVCIKPNDLNDFWNNAYNMIKNITNINILEWNITNLG